MILYSYSNSLGVVLTIRAQDLGALHRVIDGLKAQSLSKRHWRLTVVDETQGACEDLVERFLWHPKVTIVAGESTGAATNSIRAMLACRTDLVAYLDGRTCLAPDYLETAIELARIHPFVGIFGGQASIAGNAVTPTWQTNFMRLLGIREVKTESILQSPDRRYMPGPSGYLVRREHLRRFGHILRNHPFFQEAGFLRQRDDFDFRAGLARTVIQSGFSMGLFPGLKIERLVERRDLSDRQIQTHLRKDAFSRIIERFIWSGLMPEMARASRWETVALRWLRAWQFDRISRLRKAHRAGVLNAVKLAQVHAARPVLVPSTPRPLFPAKTSVKSPA